MEQVSKYQNGKIYTLRSHTTDMIYIGSTCDTLSRRKAQHKSKKRNEISKLDDFYIELLENFPCETKDELRKREGGLIRLHRDVCVNVKIEGRTHTEWRDENKEVIAEKNKVYKQENKEVIAEKMKVYNEARKEQRKVHYEANKEVIAEKMKVYNEAHKEHRKARDEANKDKINAYQRAWRASKSLLE